MRDRAHVSSEMMEHTHRFQGRDEGAIVDLLDHPRHELGVEFALNLLHLFDLDGQRVAVASARTHKHIVREELHRVTDAGGLAEHAKEDAEDCSHVSKRSRVARYSLPRSKALR